MLVLYFLVGGGQIDVLKFSPQGRSLGTPSLAEGELFWSPSFFDQGPLPARLEVKKDCQLYLWERAILLPLIRGNPDVLWDWMILLVKRMRLASEFIEELAFHPRPVVWFICYWINLKSKMEPGWHVSSPWMK